MMTATDSFALFVPPKQVPQVVLLVQKVLIKLTCGLLQVPNMRVFIAKTKQDLQADQPVPRVRMEHTNGKQ